MRPNPGGAHGRGAARPVTLMRVKASHESTTHPNRSDSQAVGMVEFGVCRHRRNEPEAKHCDDRAERVITRRRRGATRPRRRTIRVTAGQRVDDVSGVRTC